MWNDASVATLHYVTIPQPEIDLDDCSDPVSVRVPAAFERHSGARLSQYRYVVVFLNFPSSGTRDIWTPKHISTAGLEEVEGMHSRCRRLRFLHHLGYSTCCITVSDDQANGSVKLHDELFSLSLFGASLEVT
jgi:hypothetical protein